MAKPLLADELWQRIEPLLPPKRPKAYEICGLMEASLSAAGKVLCKNSMTFTVLPEPERKVNEVALFDLAGTLSGTFEANGYKMLKVGNNYRKKDLVTFFAMNADSHPVLVQEYLGAARRIVKAFGVLVLLEQAWPLFGGSCWTNRSGARR